MKTESYSFSRLVGIDISKGTLDIASAECQSATISNTKKEINSWINSLLETENTIVVMEATGGYESLLVKLLHQRKIALAVVNPRQVRDFAKGIGKNAKDRCDRCAGHRKIWRSRATNTPGCSIR
jgi:transposase